MRFANLFYARKRPGDMTLWQHNLTVGRDNDLLQRELQNVIKSTFERGIDRLARSNAQASAALQGEIAYQADLLRQLISHENDKVVGAIERSSSTIASHIQQMCDYLGSGLSEVRWSVERHNQTSETILRALLDSLSNESKQYFEQGVKCYEAGEYEMAEERFNEALKSNRTNYFAYQYLGHINVIQDRPDDALRNFDLAHKFAESDYHRALALKHLARGYFAIGRMNLAEKVSYQAVKVDPSNAMFWYEHASYAAQSGMTEVAISSLNEAITHDRNYYAVVASDPDFGLISSDVINLLNMLGSAANAGALLAVTSVRRAVDIAREVGAYRDKEITIYAKKLDEMTLAYQQRDYFVFLDLMKEAQDVPKAIFQVLEENLKSRIESKEQEILFAEDNKQKEIKAANASVKKLQSARDELQSDYDAEADTRGTMIGWGCLIIAIAYVWLGGISLVQGFMKGWDQIKGWEEPIAYLSVIILPSLIISPIMLLWYRLSVTWPEKSLQNKIYVEGRKARQSVSQIEEEFGQKNATHEKELNQLKNYLGKIQDPSTFTRLFKI